MSFAIWHQHPPFTFAQGDPEQIYQVGDKWVVTDQGQPTQAQVDAALAQPVDNGAALLQSRRAKAIAAAEALVAAAPAAQQPAMTALLDLIKEKP